VSEVKKRLSDVVTQHMRTDFARLKVDSSIGESLAMMREHPPDGRIIYFYVVDAQGKLLGVVPTRRLLLNAADVRIQDIMVKHVITLPHTATVLEACEFFMFHRLLAFPVVNAEQQLLGVIDIELYTDELTDLESKTGNDQLFQLIGVHLTDAQQQSPWVAFCNRFPWLLANIAGGILAAVLTSMFEAELQKAVALALFIPVVLALAESVSIQSVSLALQALRGKQPTLRDIVRKVQPEIGTGLFLGIACAIAVAIVAFLWLGQLAIVGCLVGGIAGGVTCAAVIGVSIPNLLRLLQREPQVAAGPIALALSDMVTLLIYFSLARWLIT
jgi:magnesium transporter